MQLVGFSEEREYLPKSVQMQNSQQKRAMFFSLYNMYVSDELNIKQQELVHHKSLKAIFSQKIEKLLKVDYLQQVKEKPPFICDIASTLIINNYRNGIQIFCTKTPKLLAAKFIQLISKGNKLELLLDLEDMFLNLVYTRAKKVNPKAKITLEKDFIMINHQEENTSPTIILTDYQEFIPSQMYQDTFIKKNIETIKQYLKRDSIRQIYLIYPKNEHFKQHIDLKFGEEIALCEDEYRVKMIPYSFSFCIKNQKRRVKEWQ